MKIQWLGHSCFKMSQDGYDLIIDPYGPQMIPGTIPINEKANQVICSHGHGDHSYVKAVHIEKKKIINPFTIETIASFHDEVKGAKRGPSNINIISSNGLKVIHFGDQGCMLSDDQIKKMEKPDVIMIPVGGFYTIDAVEAKTIVDLLHPKVILPMHYKSGNYGIQVLDNLEAFTDLYEKNDVVYYDKDSIEINQDMKQQVAVLKYSNK